MSTAIIVEYSGASADLRQISRREILRYMKCGNSDPETEALIDKGILECQNILSYRLTYNEYPIKTHGNVLDLGFARIESQDLAKTVLGCDSIILFAGTIGLEIDRLVLKYGRISPSLALCIGAIGAERIESLCNKFCLEMKVKYERSGKVLTPRFSAGYGDLPLEFQKEIFTALNCEKSIGLTLNDSLLMSPTKSVTAIIGIKNNKKNYEST